MPSCNYTRLIPCDVKLGPEVVKAEVIVWSLHMTLCIICLQTRSRVLQNDYTLVYGHIWLWCGKAVVSMGTRAVHRHSHPRLIE